MDLVHGFPIIFMHARTGCVYTGNIPMKAQRDIRAIALTTIVFFLLLLYSGILANGIVALYKLGKGNLPQGEMRFQAQFAAIAGLVSAVVVAALAIKTDQSRINLMFLFGAPNPMPKEDWMTWTYVVVWLVLGATSLALVWTLPVDIEIPIGLKWIEEYSKTFLGTAIGAGYAYFKLKPASGLSPLPSRA